MGTFRIWNTDDTNNASITYSGSSDVTVDAKNLVQKTSSTTTDNAIVRFDGTSGAVQNSSVVIDDNGNVGVHSVSLDDTASSIPANGGFGRLSNGYTYIAGKSDGQGAVLSNGAGTATVRALAPSGSNGYVVIETGNGTERMSIDSAGRVTMPYQPFFSGYWSAVSKTAGWVYPSSYPTTLVDVNNNYNSSNGLFTCPVAGLYEISFGGFIPTQSAGVRTAIAVMKNGATVQNMGAPLSTGDSPYPTLSYSLLCSYGDTLNCSPLMYSPIDITLGNGGGYYFFVQIKLLR